MKKSKSFMVLVLVLVCGILRAGDGPAYNPFHSPSIVFSYPDGDGKMAVSVIIPDGKELCDYLVDKSVGVIAQMGMAGPNGWGADSTDVQSITGWSGYSDYRLITSLEGWAPDHFRGTPFVIDVDGNVSYLSLSLFTGWFGGNNTIVRKEGAGHIIDFYKGDYVAAEAPVITETQQTDSVSIEIGTGLTLSVTVRGTLPIYSAWLHDGVVVSDRAVHPGVGVAEATLTFDIPSVSEDDEGEWVCSFINLHGRTISEAVTLIAIVDSDGDGLSDEDDAVLGTDPNNPHSDDDGLNDGDEVDLGTDPLDDDSDDDGLKDGDEVDLGTDPLDDDSDDDGVKDGDEFITFEVGWNNFAVPFEVDVATLFADSKVQSSIWRWEGIRYSLVTTLEPLKGYWGYATERCHILWIRTE